MAADVSPTSTWDTIQNVFYRKFTQYELPWALADLSDYIVAAAPNGGPIAMIRDERKVMLLGRHTPGKPRIHIYTSSGILLHTLIWDLSQPTLMYFTSSHLLVLADDGSYRLYDLSDPSHHTQHSLGSEISDLGLISAKAYNDGFVVLTGALQYMEIRGWKGGRPTALAASGLTEPPAAWALIPPDQSTTGQVQILVSTGSTIVTLDATERIDQRITKGPFSHIRLSPNGRFVALLTTTGLLWVVSADFSRNLSEVDFSQMDDEGVIPDQAEWCGDNAVVLAWQGRVNVVGPGGDCLKYDYSPACFLVPELDSLRILSSRTCDAVQKVSTASLSVFQPGSTHPASILLDALEQFERKSSKADESIRSIRPELASAVDVCIEAAGREWDVSWQRRLLRAAQFGRAFLDLYNPGDFVGMGQTMKVLNAVRYYEVGIPISYEQYIASPPSALIDALLARNLHLLALRIVQHLSLRPDPVLRHWASAKITRTHSIDGSAMDDDSLCRVIVEKFEKEGERGINYAEVAKTAWEAGRIRLATLLLDHEPRAAQQVPLLLSMNQSSSALLKAISSGDTDLVYHVLLRLRSSLSPGDFFHLLDDSVTPALTPVVKLLQVYGREGDRRLLRDFYYQDDRRTENACLDMEEAGYLATAEERTEKLKEAAKHFGEDKGRAFEAKMIDDAARLLAMQTTCERELDNKFTFRGLSVNDFAYSLIVEGLNKRAERVRADWKVSDKRWWWIKLKALAQQGDWEGLEAFAKSKKSPIGYEPFVTHLLSLSPPEPQRASSFVPRCDPKGRADLYVRCGDWGKAAEAARERGDRAKLESLRRTAPTGLAQRDVDEVIRRPGK